MAQRKKIKHELDEEYTKIEGVNVFIRTENGFSQRRYIRLKRNSSTHLVTYARYVWNKYHPNNTVKKNEEIHHIDGNALNDDIDNLSKLKRKEHAALHLQEKENGSKSDK